MFNQRPFDLQSVVHDHGCPLIGAFTTKLATCTAGGHLWATCALVIRNRTSSYVIERVGEEMSKTASCDGLLGRSEAFPRGRHSHGPLRMIATSIRISYFD